MSEEAKRAVGKAYGAAFAQLKLAHQLGTDTPAEALSGLSLVKEAEDLSLRAPSNTRFCFSNAFSRLMLLI